MDSALKSLHIDDVVRRIIPDIDEFKIDRKLTSKHSQIFKSFRFKKDATPSTCTDKNVKTSPTVNISANSSSTKDDIIDFYLDKGPSNKTEDNGDVETPEIEVITVDLSNIEQSDNESVTHEDSQLSEEKDAVDDGDYAVDLMQPYIDDGKKKRKKKKKKAKEAKGDLSSSLHHNIAEDDLYVNVDPYKQPGNIQPDKKHKGKLQEPEIMKKCVITSDFENQEAIDTSHKSVRQLKKQRKLEREKTKGDKWFNMPATEMTEERKNDYAVIQMRKALDPKRFYKANDFKVAPKYFQFGEVVESAADFYSSRVPKKQRKATVVEELLADAQFRQYNKRKYEEIQEAKRQGQGPYKHMKRLKKKKR